MQQAEGELFIGCAGGTNALAEFRYEKTAVPADSASYKVVVKGLKGGHSGCDIHLGRGNSNKLLFRFLRHAERNFGIRVAEVDGGTLRNAIPREAFAVVTVPTANVKAFEAEVKNYEDTVKKEFATADPGLEVKLEKAAMPDGVFDEKTQKNLINCVFALPNNVIRMSNDMPGLVETSTNLAIVKSDNADKRIDVICLLRSSVDSGKEALENKMESVFELAGASKIVFDGQYPGWKPNPKSPILQVMLEGYKKQFGTTPKIAAIHAGLECGLIGGVFPNLDMISFGPTIRNPHSPDEMCEISTVGKFWDYLVETLKNVPKK